MTEVILKKYSHNILPFLFYWPSNLQKNVEKNSIITLGKFPASNFYLTSCNNNGMTNLQCDSLTSTHSHDQPMRCQTPSCHTISQPAEALIWRNFGSFTVSDGWRPLFPARPKLAFVHHLTPSQACWCDITPSGQPPPPPPPNVSDHSVSVWPYIP